MDVQKKIELLRGLVSEMSELQPLNHKHPTFKRWQEKTEGYIKRLFGDRSDQFIKWRGHRFMEMSFRPMDAGPGPTRGDIEAYKSDLADVKIFLENEISNLDTFGDDTSALNMPLDDKKMKTPRNRGGDTYNINIGSMIVGGNVHWGDFYKNAPDFEARQILNQIETEVRKPNPDRTVVQKFTDQLKEKWPELTIGAAELAMKFMSGGS